MCIKSQILKEILKFVAPVMHFHFCQKYECLGANNVVLHRPSVHFGLGTVSKMPCGNAVLPSGHNVTSTNSEKFHQLLAVGRWFPPGTPVSSTRKLISSSFHRLDITLAVAEALHPNKPINQ